MPGGAAASCGRNLLSSSRYSVRSVALTAAAQRKGGEAIHAPNIASHSRQPETRREAGTTDQQGQEAERGKTMGKHPSEISGTLISKYVSVRTYNCVCSALSSWDESLNTWEEGLEGVTAEDILRIPLDRLMKTLNFGRKSADELFAVIVALGVSPKEIPYYAGDTKSLSLEYREQKMKQAEKSLERAQSTIRKVLERKYPSAFADRWIDARKQPPPKSGNYLVFRASLDRKLNSTYWTSEVCIGRYRDGNNKKGSPEGWTGGSGAVKRVVLFWSEIPSLSKRERLAFSRVISEHKESEK